jgi:biopolymer transport protein ExbD
LLDVVLQLIVFFLMLVHFGTRIEGQALGARVPAAAASRATVEDSGATLVVGIDAGGRLVAGEPAVALEEDDAEAWWAAEGERRGENVSTTLVLVRADRDARFGAVRRALATAQAHGFARFSLVVERERR